MLKVSRYERMKLMSGEAEGITRLYPSGCPHVPGTPKMVYYEDDDGNRVPFAKITIKSVRPCTVRERTENDKLAKMDGFDNGRAWLGHFQIMYGEQSPDAIVHRLQVIVEKMDK